MKQAARAFLCLALAAVPLAGCAGYRVGSIAGKDLQGVRTIFVPTVRNKSLEPALPMQVTNAIIRRLDNDGTLETTGDAHADAELVVTILHVTREPLRNTRSDVLLAAAYEVHIEASATLINRRLGRKIFENLPVVGKTEYYVQSDTQEAERQAMPLAADDLAHRIVSRVTEGW